RSDRAAEPERERQHETRKHAAVGAEHEPDAEPHDPRAEPLGAPGRALPGVADAVREAALSAVELGELLVLPQAVPADGRGRDQHRRAVREPRDEPDDATGRAQPPPP